MQLSSGGFDHHGGLGIGRPRRAITDAPLPRVADGRLVLAVDVSPAPVIPVPHRCWGDVLSGGEPHLRL